MADFFEEAFGSNLLGAVLLYVLGLGFGLVVRYRSRPALRASCVAVLAWASWLLVQMSRPMPIATVFYIPAAIIA